MSKPKYLVRNDGVMFGYSDALAKLPNFKPVNQLTPEHTAKIAQSIENEAAQQRAIAEIERAQQERADRVSQAVERQYNHLVKQTTQAQVQDTEAQSEVDVFVIANADKPALQKFIKDNFPGVKIDGRLGLDDLRSKARELAESRLPGRRAA